jgi:integrase
MNRTTNRLSVPFVKNAKPGLHPDGGGLYLQAKQTASGAISRSWLFCYATPRTEVSADGKTWRATRQMGLGGYPALSLADARKRAEECRALRAQGIDPIDARKAQRAEEAVTAAKGMTFDQCADAYMTAHRASWRSNIHARQWQASLAAYVSPVLGKLPVDEIDTGLVMKVLEPLWREKPETASRVRGRIEVVLDWAKVRGYRSGENPAQWRGHLAHLLPQQRKVQKREHYSALPYAEVPAFLALLRKQEGTAARALEFAILAAARTGEVLGARWDEIDEGAKVWTIPAERMKGNREHRVPLSPAALALIKRLKASREGAYVFAGNQTPALADVALRRVLERMGRTDITTHGFRSSFRDWCAEATNYPREIAEAALAHVTGSNVERAYRRTDLLERRRHLMEAWAKFCDKPITGKVVPLRVAEEASSNIA